MSTMACMRKFAAALAAAPSPGAVNKAMAKSMGQKVKDVIVSMWYFSLLSGLRTHVVNASSSAIHALWNVPERALAAQVSKVRRAVTGSREGVEDGEATALLFGALSSSKDAFRLAGRAWMDNQGSTPFSKIGANTEPALSAKNFGFRAPANHTQSMVNIGLDYMGAALGLPGRALMASDEFFRVVASGMEMRALAMREGRQMGLTGQPLAQYIEATLRNVSSELGTAKTAAAGSKNPAKLQLSAQAKKFHEGAQSFANDVTFTAPLGELGRGIQSLTNKSLIARVALPFVSTPINLLKQAQRRTPLALASSEVRAQIAKGGAEADLAIARMSLGTMAMGAMASLAWEGLVTGSGPSDPQMRAVWLQTKQPFSVKIGETWYSYNRADPFGMFLGAAASYAEISGHLSDADMMEVVGAVAIATADSVMSKTWMQGPAQMLDAVMEPDRYGEVWLRRNAGTFLVPTAVSQFVDGGIPFAIDPDPNWREVQTLYDALIARIPGFSKELPTVRNVWGQKIFTETAAPWEVLSPVYHYAEKDRPIDEWIIDNKVTIAKPGRVKNGVEMSPFEYERYQELVGTHSYNGLPNLYDQLNAMVEGKGPNAAMWANATDGPEGGRALIVKNMLMSYRELAWATLLQEKPELRRRVELRAREQGEALRTTIADPQAGKQPTIGVR